MEWMFLPLKRYADFSGRSRRMEFWMFQLLQVIVTVLIFGLFLASMPWGEMPAKGGASSSAEPGPLFWVSVIFIMVYGLGIFIPSLAVTIRRLHDQDKSGWWYLIAFVPFGSIVLLVFMFLEGTRGPNRWGPDPKDPGQSKIFR